MNEVDKEFWLNWGECPNCLNDTSREELEANNVLCEKCNMVNLESLEHSWTAKVKLFNGVVITLWYTAWPMSKHTVKEVLSVASDYPRSFVNKELI